MTITATPCCNLCGAAPAPAADGVCGGCGASPHDHVVRDTFRAFPLGLVDWRRARLPAGARGLNPSWFRVRADAEAGVDFIAATLPPHSDVADAALVNDALAALSPRGVAYFSRPQADVALPATRLQYMDLLVAGRPWPLTILSFDQPAPDGGAALPGWLLFRDPADAAQWRQALSAWRPALELEAGTSSDVFAPLRAELAEWQEARADCTVWWRDDDLVDATPALEQLAELSRRRQAPVLMSVIPRGAAATLAASTAAMSTLAFCQHGWAHVNHAPPGQPNSEFGPGRDPAASRADLARGNARMRELFGERFLPVLVPPWNGIADALLPALHELGLGGVSQYFGQPAAAAMHGVRRVDTHLDILDWGSRSRVRAPAILVERVVTILQLRREGGLDEPFGILSHHRAMLQPSWLFLEQLLAVLAEFPCVRWLHPRQIFIPAPAGKEAASCAA